MRKRRLCGVFSVLTLLIAAVCSGCGAEKSAAGTVSMYDLRIAMESADDTLPSMLNASSVEEDAKKNFEYISALDYEKVDSFFVSYAEEGTAEEIAVIAVRDIADVQEAKESLEEHRQKRYKLLEQYEPAEVKRIEDGIVFSSGRYAVLIICDNSSSVKKAFETFISEKNQ